MVKLSNCGIMLAHALHHYPLVVFTGKTSDDQKSHVAKLPNTKTRKGRRSVFLSTAIMSRRHSLYTEGDVPQEDSRSGLGVEMRAGGEVYILIVASKRQVRSERID